MRYLLILLTLSALPAPRAAELSEEAMSVAFDFSEIDMRKDEHHFDGNVRISQGETFIASDRATAVGASRSDRSQWTFQNNVQIQSDEVALRANTAVATVVNGTITNAQAKGSPASFEQRNASEDKRVLGRAGDIEYDIVRGVVRLTNDVWFSYGQNEFRGPMVVYYVNEERVVVNPGGKDQGRVNITVRPQSLDKPNDTATPAPADESAR
jgi:lipopolysaccharide transport protein LptA